MVGGRAPISKYRRVPKKAGPADENEIRVKIGNPPFVYMSYVAKILLIEKKYDEIFLKATGAATPNAIKITEYLRKSVQSRSVLTSDLHCAYIIESTQFTDEYEPLEEGLLNVTEKRTVSSLKIRIRVNDAGDLKKEIGYVEPYNVDEAAQEQFLRKIQDNT